MGRQERDTNPELEALKESRRKMVHYRDMPSVDLHEYAIEAYLEARDQNGPEWQIVKYAQASSLMSFATFALLRERGEISSPGINSPRADETPQ